ncbi:MAG: cytochrome c [Caulobacter sp.]|nr:cytochrome c [Caulobacter sp.]
MAVGMVDKTGSPRAQPAGVAVPSGLTLAQRYCGGCHAVPDGRSPLPGAPAFAELHQRYAPGCLEDVLTEGMLAPLRPPEEGGPRRHPSMPMAVLGDDQRAELIAYLRGLDPRQDPIEPHCAPRVPGDQ